MSVNIDELFEELELWTWKLEYREKLLEDSLKDGFPFPGDVGWYAEKAEEAQKRVSEITAKMCGEG